MANKIYSEIDNIQPIHWLHSYYNSPGFRQRLSYINNPKERQQYASNLAKYANEDVSIIQSQLGFLPSLKQFGKTLYEFFTFNPGNYKDTLRTAPTSYLDNFKTIVINKDENFSDLSPDKEFVLAHEYGHKVNPTDRGYIYSNPSSAPKEYQALHSKKINPNKHDAAYAETYSDLTATRYDLFKNNIFDSRSTKVFTEDHYNKYIDYLKKNKKQNRLVNQFPKDVFIQMMNEIAYNPITNNQPSYAKQGIK